MRRLHAIGAILALASCSGSQYGSGSAGNMSMPDPTATASSTNATVVVIVGPRAALSFDPNPAPVAQGALVVWRNMDTVPHRIVMNDGSFDSGDITPGGASQTMRLGSTGGSYHCTIHPTMMFGSFESSSRPDY